MTGRSWPNDQTSISSKPSSSLHSSGKNVLNLLVRREVCPKAKYVPKRHWRAASASNEDSSSRSEAGADAKCGLISWVEAESLRHLSAKYCPLVPPPRSTIAAAFSPDGRTLASTHGDHTVKIIDCQTGNCLKVLTGHRRTPWVVRFHPLRPEILASGSLDHEVRLWDANTSECIGSRDFYRPIASIAFHAEGDLLAVASGHKLYVWHYNKRGEASAPSIILKTRRSLRAVHFHPHGAPFLLTAEVNNLDSSDSSMTRATSLGYLQYPPPAVFVANVDPMDRHSSDADQSLMSLSFLLLPPFTIDNSRIHLQHSNRDAASSSMQMDPSTATNQLQTNADATEQNNYMVSPMDTSPSVGSYPLYEGTVNTYRHERMRNVAYVRDTDPMETNEMYPVFGSHPTYGSNVANSTVTRMESHGIFGQTPSRPELVDLGQLHQILSRRETLELPVTQGWLLGQNQHGPASRFRSDGSYENFAPHAGSSSVRSHMPTHIAEAAAVTGGLPGGVSLSGVSGGSNSSHQFSRYHVVGTDSGELTAHINNPHNESGTQPIISRIHSELATSLSATAAAELPCTVKLRIWSHDIKNPCAPLNVERCRLTIPHAVLCSEMGAHFSPCGRFLAACVACVLPNMETDPGLQTLAHQDTGAATSPTQHPISAHQVIYELRIYSLEEATFGSVLVSRAIRAAHCLTSIQFSPTSEHILLAYGRRHGSLLKSIVIDGETTLPIYTVLEVYRVSDMELVRVLPSAEDEVNVACFHPFAGGGLVYGTKEGKLRVLQYDGAHGLNCTALNFFPDENVTEVEP